VKSFPWQTGSLPTIDGQLIVAEMNFDHDYMTKLDIYRLFLYSSHSGTWWSQNNKWKPEDLQSSIKRWAIIEE
jgi:hypothetical protein